ncbi:MAG: alpha-glucosidase [Bacteroidetes bacterium]|nr:MAG: alpha-glucosidase [Bacteroidota bacterium]
MNRILAILFVISLSTNSFALDTLLVCSPGKNICVQIWKDSGIKFQVNLDGKMIMLPSEIGMELVNKGDLILNNSIASHSVSSVNEIIISPVPEKRKSIPDRYNLLQIKFKKNCSLQFRIYDDGIAYRWLTFIKDSVKVKKENASFRFPSHTTAFYPGVHKRDDVDIYHTSFEELYPLRKLDSIGKNEIAFNPVLINTAIGAKIGITESDLEDYPGMFLSGTSGDALNASFAAYPLEERINTGEFPQPVVTKRADYIATTKGTRSFPWRVLIIAKNDEELPSNDLVYRLASPSKIGDASWVKPGKCTDEWIVNVNLFNVPFHSGINTASYKYYIDFAKRFGFDRIMMDAGWSDNSDLFKINPNINMDTILSYAREKNIKVSMWTLSNALDRQLDSALARFEKWGVDFIMTDFIDRDDQKIVNYYHRIAKACADHHIMIMFHGAYPPRGFNRTYPNNITREGVLGSEYNIWSDKPSPVHDVTLPYTRMLAGSFDYEPGLLNNATQKGFRQIEGMPMSQGTRSHQLAMFIVYDNPMQIFSGNPSQGLQEPKFMELLGSLPTTWDETKVLSGKAGEFIVTARQKNSNWYIGGMTDWNERDVTISFDFLDAGSNYNATICKDGINADKYAADYVLAESLIKKGDTLKIHLAPGGGFLIRLMK